ncbi:DUF5367 family protein [Pseudozobellia thermophila]|uniref:Uncharacterized protein n=1 Tax=Pseudozobellia thermophila TaxID=192903 RepID=A0A1M6L4K5_9FLAO|nr:DUF5367 family protein [Pseudozobellia thermophila]SHJ66122.1 hypothetical protein SAMN04488513_10718 [Pseudozobellia thermophila]
MKQLRAIGIGVIIWIIGVSLYTLSFYIQVLQNAEQQANMLLFISVIPLVWYGARLYYKKETNTHGYWVGQTFFLTATALDAIITVPVFVIPNGGSYYQFFTDLGFWLIGFEFLGITVLYWYIKVEINKQNQIT